MKWLTTILAACGFNVQRRVGPPRARPKPRARRKMPTYEFGADGMGFADTDGTVTEDPEAVVRWMRAQTERRQ